jgi:quercetin 2,3-dioxygenase
MNNTRFVKEIIEPHYVIEGAGVLLRRSITPKVSNLFDPFLLFDHFAFNDPAEGPIKGFPMHPHRGIQTVTYILQGSVNHRDSLGNAGLIGPGDMQWMTAGGGILHEEMPRRGLDGKIDGFQLWVNLPAREKMSLPHYQGIEASSIPVIDKPGIQVHIIAGAMDGFTGPVSGIAGNPIYLDVTLDPEGHIEIPVPENHTCLAYVFDGRGIFGDQEVESVKMVFFGPGDHVAVWTKISAVRFVFIAGMPIGEPIVPYGPFVMNTLEEIQQALADLKNGSFVRNK